MKNTMRKESPLNFKVRVKTASGGTTSLRDAIAAKRAKSTGETSIKTKTPVAKPTQETSIKTKAPATKPTAETSVKTKAPAKKPAPVEGKPNAATVKTPATKPTTKPTTKSVTKEMIGGGGVPQLRKHKR